MQTRTSVPRILRCVAMAAVSTQTAASDVNAIEGTSSPRMESVVTVSSFALLSLNYRDIKGEIGRF